MNKIIQILKVLKRKKEDKIIQIIQASDCVTGLGKSGKIYALQHRHPNFHFWVEVKITHGELSQLFSPTGPSNKKGIGMA